MNNVGANLYHEQRIFTASPARRVVMLYEATITSLRRAIQAIDDNDTEGRWRANKRAIDIIDHLMRTLNYDQGGEIAENLEQLYLFMLQHLAKVDLDNDPAPAHEVIGLLQPLHRSWCELDQRLLAEAAGADAPQTQAPAESPCGAADIQPQDDIAGERVSTTA